MGLGVDVVDRRRDVRTRSSVPVPSHPGTPSSPAPGRPWPARRARRPAVTQSSNSGEALSDLPVAARHLDADRSDGRRRPCIDVAVEALARHLAIAHADGRRLAEDRRRSSASRASGGSDHRQQRARPVLLHLNRRVEDIERAVCQQSVHQRRRKSAGSCRRSRLRSRRPTGSARRHPVHRSARAARSAIFGEIAGAGAVADRDRRASPGAGRTCSRNP